MGLLSKLLGVTPQEAQRLIEEGATLVDVRSPGEWAQGRAPQAVHIPLNRIEGAVRKLDADRPVVTVCRSGSRSAHAAKVLRSAGYEVHNLRGGMRAWASAGLPVRAGSKPGRVA